MITVIKTARITFWLTLGIAILLTNLALIRPSSILQKTTATPTAQTGAGVDGEGAQNEAGSTDGIMIVAVVIVLIVILPILLKRQAWENGGKNRTTHPK